MVLKSPFQVDNINHHTVYSERLEFSGPVTILLRAESLGGGRDGVTRKMTLEVTYFRWCNVYALR